MRWLTRIKISIFIPLCGLIIVPTQLFAGALTMPNNKITAVVTPQIFEEAKKNDDWKLAFLTGKNAQIVFMNISPE